MQKSKCEQVKDKLKNSYESLLNKKYHILLPTSVYNKYILDDIQVKATMSIRDGNMEFEVEFNPNLKTKYKTVDKYVTWLTNASMSYKTDVYIVEEIGE